MRSPSKKERVTQWWNFNTLPSPEELNSSFIFFWPLDLFCKTIAVIYTTSFKEDRSLDDPCHFVVPNHQIDIKIAFLWHNHQLCKCDRIKTISFIILLQCLDDELSQSNGTILFEKVNWFVASFCTNLMNCSSSPIKLMRLDFFRKSPTLVLPFK